MRNFISLFITFFFLANVSAQVKVNSLGSMGIGTENPQYKLHVVGNTYLNGSVLFSGSATISGNTTVSGNISAQSIYAVRICSSGQTPLTLMANNAVAGFTGNLTNTNHQGR